MLQLRNPHSILAALQTRPQDVAEIRLSSRRPSGAWQDVSRLAKDYGIPVRSPERQTEPERQRRRHGRADKSERTGAGQATVREREAVSLEDLFVNAHTSQGARRASKEFPCLRGGLWMALDQIQDPHNVGAIFRTAAFFGVQGIVLTQDRSAPLSSTVYDVASGGLESVRFSNPPNLSRAIQTAKQAGLWVLGASEHAELDVQHVPRDRPWLLVLGNEEKGLRRLTREKCDELCRIPAKGPVTSLNVSVAAGILIATLTSPQI